jgi:hypothetical protein
MVTCAKHSRRSYCSGFIDAVRIRVHPQQKKTAIIRRVWQGPLNGEVNVAIRCRSCQHRYREAGKFAAEQEKTRYSYRLWGVSLAKVCLISTSNPWHQLSSIVSIHIMYFHEEPIKNPPIFLVPGDTRVLAVSANSSKAASSSPPLYLGITFNPPPPVQACYHSARDTSYVPQQ